MNIVKVTVRPVSGVSDSGRYIWSAWFDAVPTLDKITRELRRTSEGNELRLLLEILTTAKKGVTSTNVKSSHWTNLVRVGGTTVGVIDYKEIVATQLEDADKEEYRTVLDALKR